MTRTVVSEDIYYYSIKYVRMFRVLLSLGEFTYWVWREEDQWVREDGRPHDGDEL